MGKEITDESHQDSNEWISVARWKKVKLNIPSLSWNPTVPLMLFDSFLTRSIVNCNSVFLSALQA